METQRKLDEQRRLEAKQRLAEQDAALAEKAAEDFKIGGVHVFTGDQALSPEELEF
jgi:hypothetical protein